MIEAIEFEIHCNKTKAEKCRWNLNKSYTYIRGIFYLYFDGRDEGEPSSSSDEDSEDESDSQPNMGEASSSSGGGGPIWP